MEEGKRFGTTQPIFESTEESYKLGRLVANATFFKALFRYGDFHEYHSDVGAAMIHPDLVMRALNKLHRGPLSVAELSRHLRSQASMDPSAETYHILWMIKQGLIERMGEEEVGPR